jgi:1-acyl-sn-glycerol-3-phosphate acyltransferase
VDREVGRLYPVAKAIMTPLFRGLWRMDISGLENVPASGGAIIAPNHISVLDSFVLPAVLPRRITFVGKAEYMDSWKTKYLFPALGMIPIDRSGGSASDAALDAAAGVLGRGELFGIYPEGTRSRDGVLHKGRTGVARLSLRTGAPIVPAGIVGTREIQPPDAPMPKPFKPVTIRFGRPIEPARFRARDGDPLLYREITDEVMFEIAQLSGQDYVHEYASKPAKGAPPDQHDPMGEQRSSAELLAGAAGAAGVGPLH